MIKFFKENKLIFTIFVISILLTYSYIDFSSNMSVGTGHAYFAKSIALNHTFNINNYWGNAGVDLIKLNGNYYLPYAPGNAILMAIPYFFLQAAYFIYTKFIGNINGDLSILLESFAFSLPSSLALFGILLLLKKYAKKHLNLSKSQLSLLLTAVSMGTLLFIYSVSFFHHIIGAFYILAAFYTLDTNFKKKYFLAGTLVGLAFLTEFPLVLFCISLFIAEAISFFSKRKSFEETLRNLIQFAIPVALAICLILIYNKYLFGGFFNFGETEYIKQKIARGQEWDGFRENPLYSVYGSLFSPLKGLFVYSPFLIFGLIGIKKFIKSNKYLATLTLTHILLMVFIYTLWSDCFGATVYGTRYLVNVIPFISLLVFYGLQNIYKQAILKTAFILAIILSVFVNSLNAIFGIAQGKMAECHLYLNKYTPYHRAIENLHIGDGKPIGTAPAIIEFVKEKF